MNYFECYADEFLLKSLGFTAKDLSGGHSLSRSKVSAKLSKNSHSLGLVDEDPLSPKDKYLTSLFAQKPYYEDRHLLVFIDSRRNNKLVVIRPNLEKWIIQISRELRVQLSDYGLSDNVDSLHDMLTPKSNIAKREKLIVFINDYKHHQSIVKLRQILNQ